MAYILMSFVCVAMKKEKPYSRFTVDFGAGQKMVMESEIPYGSFIKDVQYIRNYRDLNDVIGKSGFPMKSVKPLVAFLDLPNDKVAILLGVSARTLSRWDDDSRIGPIASRTLLEIDRISKKGISIFGNAALFKAWLHQSNTALGDIAPIELLTTPYGIELVENAMEAMEYGSIL